MNDLNPSLDHWTVIFLIAAAHGFFLSWVLYFHRSGQPPANRVLAAIICLFSVSLTYYVAYWTGYVNLIHQAFGVILLFPLLYGPLFLFYFQRLSGRNFRPLDSLHFLPFMLVLLWYAPIYFGLGTTFLGQAITDVIYSRTAMLARVIVLNLHVLLYVAWLFVYLRRQQQASLSDDAFTLSKIRWMRQSAICFTGFALAFLSYYVLVHTIDFDVMYDYAISASMTIFIYTVGYLGYQQPELLRAFQDSTKQQEKYARSGLDAAQAERLQQRLIVLMENEKPYLDHQLKMDDLARAMDTSRHHLSQIINAQLGMTFSDFVNRYRVDATQRMLTDPGKQEEKIIAIAYDAGFNTKASFYNAFNKLAGTSPTEYRRRNRQQARQYS